MISTFAGTGTTKYSGDNGPATAAELYFPHGVSLDTSGNFVFICFNTLFANSHHLGNIYITDSNNYRIRKVTVSTGIITTLAGTGTSSYSGDNGQATSAALSTPYGIAVDTTGATFGIFILFH